MGPSGIEGIIGESWIEMNERTFPRAAIRATKLILFVVEMFSIILDNGGLTTIKVTT